MKAARIGLGLRSLRSLRPRPMRPRCRCSAGDGQRGHFCFGEKGTFLLCVYKVFIRLVTDKLRSYAAAHREVMPNTIHDRSQYANNRAELSHEPTRQRERTMRGFKSMGQAQRFLAVHGTMKNLFAIPRHLMGAKHYRLFRTEAFDMYQQVTCA